MAAADTIIVQSPTPNLQGDQVVVSPLIDEQFVIDLPNDSLALVFDGGNGPPGRQGPQGQQGIPGKDASDDFDGDLVLIFNIAQL